MKQILSELIKFNVDTANIQAVKRSDRTLTIFQDYTNGYNIQFVLSDSKLPSGLRRIESIYVEKDVHGFLIDTLQNCDKFADELGLKVPENDRAIVIEQPINELNKILTAMKEQAEVGMRTKSFNPRIIVTLPLKLLKTRVEFSNAGFSLN